MTTITKTTASPSKFQVGDIVTWDGNEWWQGGKAEVTSLDSEFGKDFIDVTVIEPVPVNTLNSAVGKVIAEYPRSLKLVTSAENPAEPADAVAHPPHYGGKDNPYEVIKVAEAWGLDKDAYLFNVLKYVARAGKKGDRLEDLKKGLFYYNRKIKNLEDAQ